MKNICWMLYYWGYPLAFWVPVFTMSYFTGTITAFISMKLFAFGRAVLRFMVGLSRVSPLLIYIFATEKRIFCLIWIWQCLAWRWHKPLVAGVIGSIRKPLAVLRRCHG